MERTRPLQVSLILAAGVVGACQIGKLAIAIPLLREDLGLSLVVVAWVAGAYAATGLIGGFVAGFLVSHFALRKAVIFGLTVIAAGNVLGTVAQSVHLLIASRLLESVGFLAMVVACPTLLRSFVARKDMQVVFACWSAYIPIGAILMLLLGPALMQGEWRMLWVVNAALATAMAIAIAALIPDKEAGGRPLARPSTSDIRDMIAAPAPMLLAAAFLLHAFQFFALSTFLPELLISRLNFTLTSAGMVSALVLLINAAGNIGAGFLMRRGVSIGAIMCSVFAIVGLSGIFVFADASPAALVAVAACACLGLAGLVPSAIIVTMSYLSSDARKLALGMGALQQATSFGQVVGPVVLASIVDFSGWSGGTYLYAGIGISGIALAILVQRAVGPAQ